MVGRGLLVFSGLIIEVGGPCWRRYCGTLLLGRRAECCGMQVSLLFCRVFSSRDVKSPIDQKASNRRLGRIFKDVDKSRREVWGLVSFNDFFMGVGHKTIL